MLARLAPSLPQGPDWVYEPKWDGFRALVVRQGANVRILSRNRRRLERWFPELVAIALESLPEHCALDGEILGLNDGKPEFAALLGRLAGRVDSEVQFVVFDVLELEGDNLTHLPLRQRRSQLVDTVSEGQSRSAPQSKPTCWMWPKIGCRDPAALALRE
jgi:ATP-dependent DNA ligase